MENRKKLFLIFGLLLAIAAAAIVSFYFYVLKSTESFNETVRSDKTDSSLTISIYPRGGDTDSWSKALSDGSTMTGTIFEMKAVNNSDCEISDWSEKIIITQDCYLNNAWCGKIEVHQITSTTELVQTVDLRNYRMDNIRLRSLREGQDLMVELHSGDYIIYKPSADVYEIPMAAESETTMGLILYYAGSSMDFSQCEASFRLNKSYQQTEEYGVFMTLSYAWAGLLLVYVSLLIFSIFASKELQKREKRLEESISIFSGFVDAKDAYTNGHSVRVALYSRKIARAMGYSEQAAQDVYYIGLMHDCGKCYISDAILKKPGRLTDEEFATIKTHTTRGAELLEGFTSLKNIQDGALYHHERYDGKGYPQGKAGKDIPEIARILCIADSFDAMNSKRVYRNALSPEAIRAELEKGSGSQFDPDILAVLFKMLDSGEIRFTAMQVQNQE